MSRLLQRGATPLVTGFFLVSLVSGLALFFHVGAGTFHAMHEWLSLVLILPFGLHVWKNWRPMVAYLRGAPMLASLAVALVAALAFAWPAPQGAQAGGRPQFAFAQQVLTHSSAELAPLLGATPEALVVKLGAKGFTVAGPDQSLTEVAATSGKTEAELALALLAPAS